MPCRHRCQTRLHYAHNDCKYAPTYFPIPQKSEYSPFETYPPPYAHQSAQYLAVLLPPPSLLREFFATMLVEYRLCQGANQ